MCFSATANFAGSAVLGGIGVATVAQVRNRRQVLFAALPLLFAVHQFTEGFVWLGLDGRLGPVFTRDAGAVYVLYAQGLLPLVLPLSVFLIEPTVERRRRMLWFTTLGGVLMLYILWGLIAYPLVTSIEHNSIVYANPVTVTMTVAVLYVIATCGALFFSGYRWLVWLGAANLSGLLVVMAVKRYAFTSVWCAYAAVVSVLIWFAVRSQRGDRHPEFVQHV